MKMTSDGQIVRTNASKRVFSQKTPVGQKIPAEKDRIRLKDPYSGECFEIEKLEDYSHNDKKIIKLIRETRFEMYLKLLTKFELLRFVIYYIEQCEKCEKTKEMAAKTDIIQRPNVAQKTKDAKSKYLPEEESIDALERAKNLLAQIRVENEEIDSWNG
ncbi:MAG: hypothetical protein WC492_01035 [Candidatus Micrarchaeia archaeon]